MSGGAITRGEQAIPRTAAVVGGGLAGLAAAVALADRGVRVTLFERRPYLGGRASSYQHPGTGETIDNCQHVLLGCCTNLLDFYRRIGVADKIRWYNRLTFIEPGGRRSEIGSSSMPAPLHTAPAFLTAAALSLGDKVAITRAMLRMMFRIPGEGQTFGAWLKEARQTQRAINHFWQPVLVSALNDDVDRISAKAAAFVFREAFLKSARAGDMGLSTVPLADLYARAGEHLASRGGEIRLKTPVEAVVPRCDEVLVRAGGEELTCDVAVVALPWHSVGRVLAGMDAPALAGSSITGVHLWFDREITELDHAVLLDRTIQWMFHKSRILGRPGTPSYVELVVSSSQALVEKSRQEIIDTAVRELGEFFPSVRDAQLVKATVVKEINATFTPAPGVDALRPSPVTQWHNVFLAGDWIATGWPATMEGAVRGGYLAAQMVVGERVLADDLRAQGLMRLFA